MPLKITTKPTLTPPLSPDLQGVIHLRASPRERAACIGYSGNQFGLLCSTSDAPDLTARITMRGANATCPHCKTLLPKAVDTLMKRVGQAGAQEARSAPLAPPRPSPPPAPPRAPAPVPEPSKASPYADF